MECDLFPRLLHYNIVPFNSLGKHQPQNELFNGTFLGAPFIVKCARTKWAEDEIVKEIQMLKMVAFGSVIPVLDIPDLPVACLALPRYRFTLEKLCSAANISRIDNVKTF